MPGTPLTPPNGRARKPLLGASLNRNWMHKPRPSSFHIQSDMSSLPHEGPSSFRSCFLVSVVCAFPPPNNALVIQTDFGTKDGAVAAMKAWLSASIEASRSSTSATRARLRYLGGGVSADADVSAHGRGTVFVSVVDPGVGTGRLSVVLKTKKPVFLSVQTMAPGRSWRRNSASKRSAASMKAEPPRGLGKSCTFHGRDIYAFTEARLRPARSPSSEVGPRVRHPIGQACA